MGPLGCGCQPPLCATHTRHARLHVRKAQHLHSDVRIHLKQLVKFAHLEEQHRVKVAALELPPLRGRRSGPRELGRETRGQRCAPALLFVSCLPAPACPPAHVLGMLCLPAQLQAPGLPGCMACNHRGAAAVGT